MGLSCFHGIGHGLLEDIPNPQLVNNTKALLQEPLQICNDLSSVELEKERCASGVFNVVAIYFANPRSGLKINPEEPYNICLTQEEDYFRRPCFDQMNTIVLDTIAGSDLRKAISLTDYVINLEDKKNAIHGILGRYGQLSVSKIDYSEVIMECKKLQNEIKNECLNSFLQGLFEGGEPTAEYLEAIDYCNNPNLDETEQKMCNNSLLWITQNMYPVEKSEQIRQIVKPI